MIFTGILVGKLLILAGVIGLVSWAISDMRVVPHELEKEKLKMEIQSLERVVADYKNRNKKLIDKNIGDSSE